MLNVCLEGRKEKRSGKNNAIHQRLNVCLEGRKNEIRSNNAILQILNVCLEGRKEGKERKQ